MRESCSPRLHLCANHSTVAKKCRASPKLGVVASKTISSRLQFASNHDAEKVDNSTLWWGIVASNTGSVVLVCRRESTGLYDGWIGSRCHRSFPPAALPHLACVFITHRERLQHRTLHFFSLGVWSNLARSCQRLTATLSLHTLLLWSIIDNATLVSLLL